MFSRISAKAKLSILLLLLLPTFSITGHAQAPSFDQDVVDVPIDNGLIFLIVVALYFIYRYQQFKKQHKAKVLTR